MRFLSNEGSFRVPSNAWAAANRSLEDPKKRDILVRAARAQAKSMWFVRTNPKAAAQIFHRYHPRVHEFPGQAEAILASYNNTGFTPDPDGTCATAWGPAARSGGSCFSTTCASRS
jgi:hypothetical protein